MRDAKALRQGTMLRMNAKRNLCWLLKKLNIKTAGQVFPKTPPRPPR